MISVINLATDTVITTIPVQSFAEGIAITPNSQFAYITNNDVFASNVSVINTASNTVVATIPVGLSPRGVAI
ncbi:YncE family protein, partial [Bacillus toyonensis]|uniref:YncE family protein n=1 Tax=Bacillus toyonensis TaxID=155322 RepID=UPI003AA88D97